MKTSTLYKQIQEERQKVYDSIKKKDIQEYYRQKTNELTSLRGIKKKAIAEALSINRNSLYKWLRGDFNLSQDNLNKLDKLVKLFEA